MADDAWTPPVTFLDSNGAAIPPGEGGAGHVGDAQWSPPVTLLDENGQPTQPIGAPATPPPSILRNGWRAAGTELLGAGTRGVGLGARDVIQGVTAPFTGLLDVLTWPGRVASRAAGLPTTAPSDLASKVIDATNLPTPATPTEKNISTFNRGAAATLPSLVVGGYPALAARVPSVAAPLVASPTASAPQVARVLASGGTGAVAGEKAAESPYVPTYLKPYANLAAGIAAARFADAGLNLGGKAVNAVAGNMSPTYEAFRRQGVDTRLLGTVAGGETMQSAEGSSTRIPFVASVLRPVQQRTIGQFGTAVERTASELDPAGKAVTAQATGEQLQDAARNWRSTVFPAEQAAVWNPLDQRLAGTSVNPAPFRAALAYAASPPALASLPETQRAWASAQAARWLDALNADVGRTGNLSWEQAAAIRTRIGDAMGTPEIMAALGGQQFRRIYGGLSEGMRQTARAHGQERLFDEANGVTTAGHAFIDNTLTKIIRNPNPAQETVTPDQATKSMLDSDSTHMQALRDRMPEAADYLGAFKLRQAQTAKPSVATQYDDTSTGTFLSNLNRMRQTTLGGYDALYNTRAIQRRIDDLTTIAGRLRQTERHVNTSGTAEQAGWQSYLLALAAAAGSGSGTGLAGIAAGVPLAGHVIGRALTSPTLTRFGAARGLPPPPLESSVAGLLGSSANMPTITVRPGRQ